MFGSSTSTGDDFVYSTGTAGTVAGAIEYSVVGSSGLLLIKNTGATNNLLVSLDGGSTFPVIILPGHANLISTDPAGEVQVKTASSTTTYEAFLTEA